MDKGGDPLNMTVCEDFKYNFLSERMEKEIFQSESRGPQVGDLLRYYFTG